PSHVVSDGFRRLVLFSQALPIQHFPGMSGEELVLSMVCCNLEPPIYTLRRKVSFADAFGLDLVSVKEYDNRNSSRLDAAGRESEEYYISCLFIVPVLHQDMEVRLQQQKLELERIELLPGSTTIRGIVRVLNLCFHKAVYIRVTLDGWQSHFDLLAEYMPGSSDGETDCFSFHLVLTPPFQVEGLRVEFCLRYESAVGTFWANNGGTNYIVFCHQRRRSDLKEKESEKEKLLEESNQKGIRSCLKTIRWGTLQKQTLESSLLLILSVKDLNFGV
uniref:CBM21 domain-containing protein n=1 Tax=Cyprinus carpio TaxID=7962 RepID=A0A8C1PAV3_CYPCA